jgi:hypothetical protein
MRPINLLPRVPLSRRLLKPVIAAIIMVTAVVAVGIFLLYDQYRDTNRMYEAEIARLETQMLELLASERPPRYADVTAYRELVERLERSGRDWGPMFELAGGLLPRGSSIASVAADENGKVTLSVRMSDLAGIAAYSAALREAEPVADAAVVSIRLESSLTADGAAVRAVPVYSALIELQLAHPTGTEGAGS